MTEPNHHGEEPVFRASKRRKIIRRRLTEDDDEPVAQTSHLAPPSSLSPVDTITQEPPETSTNETTSQSSLSISEVIRLRKASKPRRTGIEFSNTTILRGNEAERALQAQQLEVLDGAQSVLDAASARFAPPTGQIATELDKHMIEYIDSKMAELHKKSSISETNPAQTRLRNLEDRTVQQPSSLPKDRQAAGVGKLQEVDLGPDTTLQNISRTEALRLQLENKGLSQVSPLSSTDDAHGSSNKRNKSQKSGGQPRRRYHSRRTSTDIARDALVDQVLRESRLGIYEETSTGNAGPGNTSAGGDEDDDQAADDRIAEQFRRDFMDSMQTRNNLAKRPIPGPKGGEEKTKGPKLGGSRSARAAMKAAEEAASKKR